ncbi:MAG: 50S ribosomal protein L17 [Candidatus Levybacteria bacterium]|nr:50S ribosomal protein L17 [Candidatus Levybacteria bacterium]
MRKNVFGRKFKRDTNERKALFKSLISSLILNGKIKTTLEKAKAIKGDVDKIANKAKKGEARYLLQPILDSDVLERLIKNIVPRVSDRNSGYTKLTKLGRRFSDNAQMVLMEWIGEEIKDQGSRLAAKRANIKNENKKLAIIEAPVSAKASAGKQKKREVQKARRK